jgi:hypothetical protein
MELPDLIVMARRLGGKANRREDSTYPEMLADLTPDALRELGDEYLERTRVQRKRTAPSSSTRCPTTSRTPD